MSSDAGTKLAVRCLSVGAGVVISVSLMNRLGTVVGMVAGAAVVLLGELLLGLPPD